MAALEATGGATDDFVCGVVPGLGCRDCACMGKMQARMARLAQIGARVLKASDLRVQSFGLRVAGNMDIGIVA